MTTDPLDILSIGGVYLLTVLLSLLVAEIGYRVGRRRKRHLEGQKEAEKEGNVGAMVGSTLALLAFLLVYLVGFASNRFEARRLFVVDEANAIRTTYLRAGYLAEPERTEFRQLLREYVAARLLVADWDTLDEGRMQSEQLQAQLWSRAEHLAQAQPDSMVLAIFIESLNGVIDMHTKRVQAVQARVPPNMMMGIYFVALLAMGMVGYQNGMSGGRHFTALVVLILVFSAVILLIVDLDRPRDGLLRVSQQALIDLQQQLNTTP
jgi:hypothetical protein